MGLIDAFFGGSKTAEKTVDFVTDSAKGIGSWIDGQQFTDQEKSVANLKIVGMVLKGIELTRDENSTRSVTRRYLAWAVMGSYLTLNLGSAIVYKLDKEYAEYLFKLANDSGLGELALGVGMFYFLTSIVRANKK